MKLLHISDLHYGHVWRGVPRLPDQNRVLDEILGICETKDVQLMLFAGDVFSNRLEGTPARITRMLLERLTPHLRRGMVVFLLWGNHDNLPLFELMRTLTAELAGGADRWPLVIADQPGIYELPGLQHVVIGLPYLSPPQLMSRAVDTGFSPEEQATALNGQLSQYLRWLYAQAEEKGGRPAIFATHFLVEGFTLDADEGQTFESYHHDLRISPADLPHFTSYNALGHVHLQQKITGAAKPSWYCGAPDRMDLGEREYTPGVLLVDEPGGVAEVESVPIQACTPFVKLPLSGQEAIAEFCTSVADSDPLGEVLVSDIEISARAEVLDRLHAAAPRTKVLWARPAASTSERVSEGLADPANPLSTVRSFLAERFKNDAEVRGRLVAAFEQLVAADEASAAEAPA